MIIKGASLTDYSEKEIRTFTFETNCYWVTITDRNGKKIFSRGGHDKEWLDEKHRAIADALNALENALIDATK